MLRRARDGPHALVTIGAMVLQCDCTPIVLHSCTINICVVDARGCGFAIVRLPERCRFGLDRLSSVQFCTYQ